MPHRTCTLLLTFIILSGESRLRTELVSLSLLDHRILPGFPTLRQTPHGFRPLRILRQTTHGLRLFKSSRSLLIQCWSCVFSWGQAIIAIYQIPHIDRGSWMFSPAKFAKVSSCCTENNMCWSSLYSTAVVPNTQ